MVTRLHGQTGAFTKADLVTLAAVLALLGGWLAHARLGERGRIGRCARNLAVLGQAMASYANDHNDGIPAAAIDLESAKRTWDTDLLPYLKPGLAKSDGAYQKRQLVLAAQPLFCCPSDPVLRGGHPRSYAMSGRDMLHPWPPGPDDLTGVGLLWAKRTVAALADDLPDHVLQKPELLPQIKRTVLPAPAETLLLTEFMTAGNTMGNVFCTRLWGVNEQEPVFKQSPRLHYGRFNYLLADGHVELLTKLQTGGGGGNESPSGIWTIKAGD